MRTYEDFLSVSVYCRDRMNPNMFIYALSVAILHRPDTKNLPIPPLHEVFPDKYIDGGIFSRAREEANISSAGQRVRIDIISNGYLFSSFFLSSTNEMRFDQREESLKISCNVFLINYSSSHG